MIPPTKLQETIYRFNTKLMHIWFIVSDYLPRRLISRLIARKAFKDSRAGKNSWFVKRERQRQLNYFKKVKNRLRKQGFKRANKKFAEIASEPLVHFDKWDDMWWVDTGHSDVGPFLTEKEAQTHADRIKEDYKVAKHA